MRDADSIATYDSFTAQTGHSPAIWMVWRNWLGDNATEFPKESFLRHLRNRRTVPMITWQPADPEVWNRPKITYRKILAGRFDGYIRSFARDAAAYGGPVILRFAHEMDGAWFPWGIHRFNNSPSTFKTMWRYVWRMFQDVGATNVRFLWAPNTPCSGCVSMKAYFPGDRYVDYVGFSSFNWGEPSNRHERRVRPNSKWKTMLKTVGPGVEALKRVSERPIIVAETASTSDAPRGRSKAGWIRNGYPNVYQTFKRVKAIVYFNIDMRAPPDQHEDWRLAVPDGRPRDAYRALLGQTRFQGRLD
jgi:beta-mannanase